MFILDHNGHDPLYMQLYKQIREHIQSGRLPADARLPSVRDLADELSTSRNTVESSYQELHAEGYIYAKPRSGYFVAGIDHDVAPDSTPHKAGPRGMYADTQPACDHDFHPARLDPDSFPAQLWRRHFLDCLRDSPRQLTQYRAPQGERELRQAIQKYLERSRGTVCDPEQVVICSGLQQSLDIVASLLRETHPMVAVENPGYPLPRSVFRNHSFDVAPIPVGPDGIDLEALKNSGSRIAYVTPSHQFPLGFVMPLEKRLELIAWAESGGNVIIEDDYDSELRYHGKPIPSLQGLHPHGNIVYTGTFSKILSPALRVSYMVLPRSLLSGYRRRFHDYLASVPLLEQDILTRFMEQGHWERHVRRMRTLYKLKHNALLDAIDRHFGSRTSVVGQGAGLHVVLELSGLPLSEQELVARAKTRGIRLFPFSETCANGTHRHATLILGFGGMTPEEIERGTERLAGICREEPD